MPNKIQDNDTLKHDFLIPYQTKIYSKIITSKLKDQLFGIQDHLLVNYEEKINLPIRHGRIVFSQIWYPKLFNFINKFKIP